MARKIELTASLDSLPSDVERSKVVALATEWYESSTQLAALKSKESLLRDELFTQTFRGKAVEGTNKFGLSAGWILNVQYPYNYKVDPAIAAAAQPLKKVHNIDINRLIDWKPELKISEYRLLTDEQKAAVAQFLTITPSKPQMKIVLPKR